MLTEKIPPNASARLAVGRPLPLSRGSGYPRLVRPRPTRVLLGLAAPSAAVADVAAIARDRGSDLWLESAGTRQSMLRSWPNSLLHARLG